MRIVLTRNGTMVVRQLSPLNSKMKGIFIDDLDYLRHEQRNKGILAKKELKYRLQNMSKSVNKFKTLSTKSYNKSSNYLNTSSNATSKNNLQVIKSIKNITLHPNKNNKVPAQFAEKYEKIEKESKFDRANPQVLGSTELLSNVWKELNDSMREYREENGELSEEEKLNKNKLPSIYDSYPLRVIINQSKFKSLEKEEIKKEKN